MPDKIPLLLFAKAPIPGKVKTRLTTHCTTLQAARIAEILMDASLAVATRYWPGKVVLSIWQQYDHPFIQSMLDKYSVTLASQVAGDLGQKMHRAFDQAGYPSAIMGCDAPLIDTESLVTAHQSLFDGNNIIGPSDDGGYYLIGLSESASVLFKGIDWGTDSVFAATMKLAKEAAIPVRKLPECYDIDRWDDVIRASQKLPCLMRYLVSEGLPITPE